MKDKSDNITGVDRQALEEDFKRESTDFLVHRTRFVLAIGIPAYLAFWLLDLFVAQGQELLFLILRLGASAVFVFVYWLTFLRVGKRAIAFLSVIVFYLAGLVIAIMTVFLGGFTSTYYVGIMLVCMVAGLFLPWKFDHTLLFCAAILLSYFGLNYAFHGVEPSWDAAEPAFFLGATCFFNIFGAATNLRRMQRELTLRLQLEMVNSNLKKLDEAKTRLIANVSHELRTPLTLIVGPIESILAGKLDDHLRSVLEITNTNARRLLRQVNMLLDMTAIECGKMRLKPKRFNLGSVLEGLVSAAEPQAVARKIRLKSEGLDSLPDSILDPEKIEIVGSNLLSNAIKFTPEGGSVVIRADYDESSVIFTVQDSGPGIPAKDRKRIFERFYQVDNSTSREHEGSGLGLALVRELVNLHGGSIRLNTKLGSGSTFIVRLPRQLVDQPERRCQYRRREDQLAAVRMESLTMRQYEVRRRADTLFADVESARNREGGCPSIVSWNKDGPRVLVVEDNHDLRRFIAESLSSEYHVNTAKDGQEGLDIALSFRPDLVVADIMIPGMDGYTLCRKLKEDEKLALVPIILVTAKSGPEAVVQGLDAGADDYLVKPFDIRELKARMAAQLRARGLEKKLGETESRLAAVGRMTSSIIQVFRAPLQSMMGLTQMLLLDVQEGDEPSQLAVDLHTLTKQAERLQQMLEELLDFARTGSMRLDIKPTLIRAFLIQLLEKAMRDMERVGIELVVELRLEDGTEMPLDQKQIHRLLDTLLANARDTLCFYDCGGKEHRVWIRAHMESDQLVIRIADNGPGVPEELVDQLFVPFGAVSEKRHGLGLGLVIARNLAKAHGGNITLEPKPPEGGTAFTLVLPRCGCEPMTIPGLELTRERINLSEEYGVQLSESESSKDDRHRLS